MDNLGSYKGLRVRQIVKLAEASCSTARPKPNREHLLKAQGPIYAKPPSAGVARSVPFTAFKTKLDEMGLFAFQ